MFRVIFPKDSRGRFPVTRGCDTLGAPGRDSPTPSQLCRVPLDTDSRSPKTFGDIKPTTVMRSEGSRLGILSQSRESFGIEFRTFAGQEVKTQNPKNPQGMKPETTQEFLGKLFPSSLNKQISRGGAKTCLDAEQGGGRLGRAPGTQEEVGGALGSTWLCHVFSQTTHLWQKNQARLGRAGGKFSFLMHF